MSVFTSLRNCTYSMGYSVRSPMAGESPRAGSCSPYCVLTAVPPLQQCQVHLACWHPKCAQHSASSIFFPSTLFSMTWLGLKSPCEAFPGHTVELGAAFPYFRVPRVCLYSGTFYLAYCACLLTESFENTMMYSRAKTIF